ncbi:hypothetical protein B0H10DRAFT_1068498 [Mycena sp. CBHHK59/15]|nr:hypothetical protein B0H10DRAFT_1068498 [Mycena sp. CBHHK59/15]
MISWQVICITASSCATVSIVFTAFLLLATIFSSSSQIPPALIICLVLPTLPRIFAHFQSRCLLSNSASTQAMQIPFVSAAFFFVGRCQKNDDAWPRLQKSKMPRIRSSAPCAHHQLTSSISPTPTQPPLHPQSSSDDRKVISQQRF